MARSLLVDLAVEHRKKPSMGDRRIGWVKFFSAQKGYGFVTDVVTNTDAFVHYTSIQRRTPGWRGLYKGEYISFTEQVAADKTAALDVTALAWLEPSRLTHRMPPSAPSSTFACFTSR